MVSSVLISGAGQLGSRYLQGLAKCRLPLRIYVQDIREDSLDRARQRWNEVFSPEFPHGVSFHTSLEALPRLLDVAILATTADVRPQVAARIASHAIVRFWVLEKILAQSEAGLDELMLHVRNGSKAWVNTPRRAMSWHQKIKSQLALDHPLTLEVKGGQWGLACNAVHFLDLLAWWTGETLEEISTDDLGPGWFESKRPRFLEVFGTLEARFSRGSHALLSALESESPVSIVVNERHRSWEIDEAAGWARRSDGIEIQGRLDYQSEIAASLVESILEGGRCELPTLEDSAGTHRALLRSMEEHWRRAGHPTATCVPIT